jgi:TonB family protein
MRAVAALISGCALGCGGKPPPPPEPPPAPAHVATKVPVEDTEPEDNVSAQQRRGGMSEAAIQAGLSPHADEMSACYTDHVGKRRWLGGHVTIKWELTADGDITSVKLIDSDLGAHAIENCLLDVARATSFGKPTGGAPTEFTVPLEFSLTAKGKPPVGVDVWDEDRAQAAITAKQLAKLDACGKGGEGNPDDVVVTIYVGWRGAVQSVGFSSGRSEITEKWGDCAEKAALAWRLADPKGTIVKLAIHYRQ